MMKVWAVQERINGHWYIHYNTDSEHYAWVEFERVTQLYKGRTYRVAFREIPDWTPAWT